MITNIAVMIIEGSNPSLPKVSSNSVNDFFTNLGVDFFTNLGGA